MPAVDRRVITGLISVVFAIRLLSSFYLMADLTGFDESRRHCFDALPVDGFHAFRRERQGDRASKRRYVITLPLQVRAEGAAGFSM